MDSGQPSPDSPLVQDPPPLTEEERHAFAKDSISGDDLKLVYRRLRSEFHASHERLVEKITEEVMARCLEVFEERAAARDQEVDSAIGQVIALTEEALDRIDLLECPESPRCQDAVEARVQVQDAAPLTPGHDTEHARFSSRLAALRSRATKPPSRSSPIPSPSRPIKPRRLAQARSQGTPVANTGLTHDDVEKLLDERLLALRVARDRHEDRQDRNQEPFPYSRQKQ